MSNGQWRVFALLLLLLFMEAIRDPNIGSFFSKLAFNPFKRAVS
jgi:hypothetical protein